MKSYSQKNPRWAKQQLGTCDTTIGASGCKISAYAMLLDDKIVDPKGRIVECHPGIMDWIATIQKLYVQGCMTVDEKFCKFFGLEYNGKKKIHPDYPCIAETNYYANKGVLQHFFIIYPDGDMLDPLDGNALNNWTPKKRKNIYPIVSYRWIKPRGWKEEVQCTKCCPAHCGIM